jgi:hypothetical protein
MGLFKTGVPYQLLFLPFLSCASCGGGQRALADWTFSATSGPAAGGTTLTLRGSGFQSTISATLGCKSATVTFKDINTLSIVTPALSSGPHQLVLTKPDGESVSFDAALTSD